MKIFIKDIPVIIISDQDFIKTTSFDKIYEGSKLELNTESLQGAVLVNNATLGIIDSFMVFLKQNQLTELEDITFRVSDYDVVIDTLKEEYEIIRAAGGLVFKQGEVLMIWRLKR